MSDIWSDAPEEGGHEDITFSEPPGTNESSSFGSVVGASFRQYNTIYSLYKAFSVGRFGSLVEDDVDVSAEFQKRGIVGEDRDFFKDVKNYDQLNSALEFYYQDKADKKILSDASIASNIAAGLVTGIADPINWIPVGRALKFGSSLVRAGIEGSVIGLANASVRGKANNRLDVEDVATETIAAGIGSVLFAGAVKGAGKVVNSSTFARTQKAVKEMLTPVTDRWFEFEGNELFQKSVRTFGIVKEKATQLVKNIVFNSPYEKMRNSGDTTLATVGKLLFRDRVRTPSKDEFFGITAEERLSLWRFEEHKLAEEVNALREKFVSEGGQADVFNKTLMRILNSTPIGGAPQKNLLSENSYVDEAANRMHTLFKSVIEAGKAFDALPENFAKKGVEIDDKIVVTRELADLSYDEFIKKIETGNFEKTSELSKGYVTRSWDTTAVYENLDKVRDLLAREIKLNNPDITSAKMEQVINHIVANISDSGVKSLDDAFSSLPAWVNIKRSRIVAIEDEVLQDLGLIHFDPVEPALRFWRGIIVESELNRVAQEAGAKGWADLKAQYQKQNTVASGAKIIELRERGISADDAAVEMRRFAEEKSRNLSLLNDVENLFKGKYGGNTPQWIDGLKSIQYASQAGQLALSMMTDPAMLMLRVNAGRSIKRFLGAGQNAVISLAQKILPDNSAQWLESMKTHDKNLVQKAFGFLDRALMQNRFDDLAGGSQGLARITNELTGVNALTRSLKRTAAEEIYSTILTESLKETGADAKFLQQCGITADARKEIVKAFAERGVKNDDLLFLDLDALTLKTADTIRASVQTLVEQTFLTPGLGNVPLALRNSVGSFFFMFKTYPFLLYNEVFLPLFRGDIKVSKFAAATAGTLALSTTRKMLVDYVNDRDTDFDDPRTWREIFEYSALSTFITDAAELGYDLFHGTPVSSGVSPTLSWLQNVTNTVTSLLNGRRKEKTWRRARNLTPGLNWWWARPITNPFFN